MSGNHKVRQNKKSIQLHHHIIYNAEFAALDKSPLPPFQATLRRLAIPMAGRVWRGNRIPNKLFHSRVNNSIRQKINNEGKLKKI